LTTQINSNPYKKSLINFLIEIGIKKQEIPNTLINVISELSLRCISDLIKEDLCPELSNSTILGLDFENKFSLNGYAIIKNVIDPSTIKLAKKELKKIRDYEIKNNISHLYGEGFKFQRVYNLLDKSDIFLEIINIPAISQAMEIIFDRPTLHDKFYLSSFQSNTLLPGAVDQIWHIDANVPPPIPDWTMRVQTAILLDEFNATNGGTEILPQSHKLLKHPSIGDVIQKNNVIKIQAEPGTIVFWHGNTWHRSTANKDTKERNALLACFSTSFFREVCLEENHFRIISKEKFNKFPENTKRILGYYHGIKRGVNSYI
jgi:ectoine hydroxylase-related dioxygenase (phytanoyl-CoA dioxygenase family)